MKRVVLAAGIISIISLVISVVNAVRHNSLLRRVEKYKSETDKRISEINACKLYGYGDDTMDLSDIDVTELY